jgi:hypothetical protein
LDADVAVDVDIDGLVFPAPICAEALVAKDNRNRLAIDAAIIDPFMISLLEVEG